MTMKTETTSSSWVWLGRFPDLDLGALLDNLDPHELLPVLLHDGAPAVGTVDELMADEDELLARITSAGAVPAARHYELRVSSGADTETGVDIGPELRALYLVPALQDGQDGPQSPDDGYWGARAARAPLEPAVAALLGIFPSMSPAEAELRLDATDIYLATQTQTQEPAMNSTATRTVTPNEMQLARQEALRTGRSYQECLTAVQLQGTRSAFPSVRLNQRHGAPGAQRVLATTQHQPSAVALEIEAEPGPNIHARARSYLASRTAGWDRMSNEERHGKAVALVKQHGLRTPEPAPLAPVAEPVKLTRTAAQEEILNSFGPNIFAKAKSYLASRTPAWDRMSNEQRHERAVSLVAQHDLAKVGL